jgi:ubiquinone/menaquinone biosynthesis C-methylase UbiE
VDDNRKAVAGVFDRAAPTYDAVGVEFFQSVGARLLALADLQPGESVLDVGCGRGAVLLRAAEAVGPEGSALGIDLAPTMVELTREDARRRGLLHVDVQVMDAQEPELPEASYDAVLSSLVVFFLPDPVAGLRAWRAAARPGGRLVLTTFASRDDDRWAWLEDAFPTRDRTATTADAREDSPFDTDEDLHALLTDAGWAEPSSVEHRHESRFADPEQWLRWSWSHGMRMYWERTPEDQRDDVRALVLSRLHEMQAEHGELSVWADVRYTTARAGS